MAKPVIIKFNGIANKIAPDDLPLDKLWRAENVLFNDNGELIIPGPEFSSVLAGTCHSINHSVVGTLFSASGSLWLYDGTDTPVELLADVGSNEFSYSQPVGDTVYFSNGTVRGRYIKGESTAREWGTAVPTAEPTVQATVSGGMDGGEYRVVTTWVGYEESGAGNSVAVTVPQGGGIVLSGFPDSVPAYVTHFAVWCSMPGGKDLYFYGEYPIATTQVVMVRFKGTIKLETQLGEPPAPPVGAPIVLHYGRLYWANGSVIEYSAITETGPRYGVKMPDDHFGPFDDGDVQTIVSQDGVLYVGTDRGLYAIRNIDAPDGSPAVPKPLQLCGSVRGSECYDPNGDHAYFMTHRGLILATPSGLKELTYEQVAMPFYASGCSMVIESKGIKYLLFSGQDGTKNDLANDDWNDEDWGDATSQDSGWSVNLKTGATSKYDFTGINRFHGGYSSGTGGIGTLTAATTLLGLAQTGSYDFGSSVKKRMPDLFAEINGKSLKLVVTTDNGDVDYATRSTTRRETVEIDDMARGAKGRYWQFEFTNKAGNSAIVSELEPKIIAIQRHK